MPTKADFDNMLQSRQRSALTRYTARRRPTKADAYNMMQSAWDPAVSNGSESDGPSTADEPTGSDGGGEKEGADQGPASTSSPPAAEPQEREAAAQPGFVSRLASAVQKGRSLGWLPMP